MEIFRKLRSIIHEVLVAYLLMKRHKVVSEHLCCAIAIALLHAWWLGVCGKLWLIACERWPLILIFFVSD